MRLAAGIASDQFSGTFANSCPVANNIEELNTNDSVVDACVRLWVIADFFTFKELQDEAVAILEKHCEEQMNVLCVIGERGDNMVIGEQEYQILLAQLFRGIETAYEQYPHSVPCQQVLVSLFHAVRVSVFSDRMFSVAMSKAPHQFSHELLMATIDGRQSKWVLAKHSEFLYLERNGDCSGCRKKHSDKEIRSWVIDPSGQSIFDLSINTPWRCISCFEKHGFKPVDFEDKT